MDFPISQLRVVRYYFRVVGISDHTEYLMHETQVPVFLEALIALHYLPGINPHNGNKCSELWEVKVGKLQLRTESYWWCTPTLGVRGVQAIPGANLNYLNFERVWAHPELIQYEDKLAAEEEAWEYENS